MQLHTKSNTMLLILDIWQHHQTIIWDKKPLFCQKEAVFLKRHSLYGNNSSSNNGRHFKDNHLEKET